jgi:hypothetical protein
MTAAYHGNVDCPAAELGVNPFAPSAQTAARLRGCDPLGSGPRKNAAMLFKAVTLYTWSGGYEDLLSWG